MIDNFQEEFARMIAAYKAGENEANRKKCLYIAIAAVSAVLVAVAAFLIYKKVKFDNMDDFDEDFDDDDEDFWEEFDEEKEEEPAEKAEEACSCGCCEEKEQENNDDLFEPED